MYIRKKNGIMESRPESPYMGSSWNECEGYVVYAGALPLTHLDIAGGTMDP